MKNESDIEFTGAANLPQGVDFKADTGSTDGMNGESTVRMPPLEQAKQKAQSLVSSARDTATDRLQTQYDLQRGRAVDSLSNVAETLRGTTQNIPVDSVKDYINQAADRVDEVAHYLQDREMAEIVDTVEDFARRKPMAFLGGAFALGIIGARFLKSSQGGGRSVRGGERDYRDDAYMGDPRDAVSRPQAEGYASPAERAGSDFATGPGLS